MVKYTFIPHRDERYGDGLVVTSSQVPRVGEVIKIDHRKNEDLYPEESYNYKVHSVTHKIRSKNFLFFGRRAVLDEIVVTGEFLTP